LATSGVNEVSPDDFIGCLRDMESGKQKMNTSTAQGNMSTAVQKISVKLFRPEVHPESSDAHVRGT